MTREEIIKLLYPAMTAAKKSGIELWAVAVIPGQEGIHTCWEPSDSNNPILQDTLLSGIASLCASADCLHRQDTID